ncbi:LysR substrate-binding domain-containing protein [Vreelandella populi]|uniref:LysR substrate-binding domain-containing protein n=1 Tax=Vreelandella populi TaxID=2498858 RepID=UPI001C8DFE97
MAQGSALQDHINDQARTAGRLLDLRIRMKTYEGVCEMVSHGVGIGILPQSVAKRYRRRHSYATLLLTDAWARRQLCLCFREWKVLSAPMQRLLTHLGTSQGKPNVSS